MANPRTYGPEAAYGSKIKSTTVFLTLFLELCRDKRPCNVSYCQHAIYWKMRKDMLAENPNETFDKKCARIMGNALQRIMDAYHHCNPDSKTNEMFMEISMLTINEYIGLLEYAIDLPREFCRDGPTNI